MRFFDVMALDDAPASVSIGSEISIVAACDSSDESAKGALRASFAEVVPPLRLPLCCALSTY